ncbi:MAG: nucleotidyltransferase domain-containing protein [Chloroflexi bacterium]|nr:nucleotidyltransferase domain-containing protein [Chloroflexota bacterium]
MIKHQRVNSKSLRAITQKIVSAISPERVILFGSFVYGKPTPDSDVDLLIIWNTRKSYPLRYRAISDLLRPRPFPLDIIVKTPREIAVARKRVDPFLNEALEKGKTLYARQARRQARSR